MAGQGLLADPNLHTGTGPDGKPQRRFVTIHGRKSDAEKKRNELLVTLAKGAIPLCIEAELVGVSCHLRQTADGTSAGEWQIGRGFAMAKGTIRRLIRDKSYGFIQTGEGKEL
jgi:hypothetical protein